MPFLILGCVLVTCLAGAAWLSHAANRADSNLAGAGTEVSEHLSLFLASLRELRHPAFLPLWAALSLILGGLLTLQHSILGCLPIAAGQQLWLLRRRETYGWIRSGAVPPARESALVWTLRSCELFGFVAAFAALDPVSEYALVLTPARGFAWVVTLGLLATGARSLSRKERPDSAFPVKAMVAASVLAAPVLTLNYALDHQLPLERWEISYGACPSRHNQYFTAAGDKIPDDANRSLIVGCEFFYALEPPPPLTARIETLVHPGALGITWRKTYPLP